MAALLLGTAPAAVGQVRSTVPMPTTPPADSSRAPATPLGAFFRSLVLPGWGQAVLDRKLTGGLFLLWEGITLAMTTKVHQEVQFVRATEDTRNIPSGQRESSLLRAKRAEREDWLVLLAFNHLFSGLEAYVAAHFTDFPGDLRFGAVPGPRGPEPVVGLRLPIRLP